MSEIKEKVKNDSILSLLAFKQSVYIIYYKIKKLTFKQLNRTIIEDYHLLDDEFLNETYTVTFDNSSSFLPMNPSFYLGNIEDFSTSSSGIPWCTTNPLSIMNVLCLVYNIILRTIRASWPEWRTARTFFLLHVMMIKLLISSQARF